MRVEYSLERGCLRVPRGDVAFFEAEACAWDSVANGREGFLGGGFVDVQYCDVCVWRGRELCCYGLADARGAA